MSASALVRWGALSAVVGGALLAASDLWGLLMEGRGGDQSFSETAATGTFALTSAMSLLAAVLILFGLVGLHLRQSGAGRALSASRASWWPFLGRRWWWGSPGPCYSWSPPWPWKRPSSWTPTSWRGRWTRGSWSRSSPLPWGGRCSVRGRLGRTPTRPGPP